MRGTITFLKEVTPLLLYLSKLYGLTYGFEGATRSIPMILYKVKGKNICIINF